MEPKWALPTSLIILFVAVPLVWILFSWPAAAVFGAVAMLSLVVVVMKTGPNINTLELMLSEPDDEEGNPGNKSGQ